MTKQQVSRHLPRLRRFARALTGSQKSGDAYVRAVLEVMLADPEIYRTVNSSGGLYETFHKIWSSSTLPRWDAGGRDDMQQTLPSVGGRFPPSHSCDRRRRILAPASAKLWQKWKSAVTVQRRSNVRGYISNS